MTNLVAFAQIPPPQKPDSLYRKDRRNPAEIFQAGFRALGTEVDLFRHIAGYNSMGAGRTRREMTAFISATSSRSYADQFQAAAIHHEQNEQWVYEFNPPQQTYDALHSLQVERRNLQDPTLAERYRILSESDLQREQAQWVTYGAIPPEYIRRAHLIQYSTTTQQTTVVRTVENGRYNPFLANGASIEAFDVGLVPGQFTLGSDEQASSPLRTFILAFSCLGIQSGHNYLRSAAPTCPEPSKKTVAIEGDLNKTYFTQDGGIGYVVSSIGNDDAWVDFNGDGSLDYCAHYYGVGSKDLGLQCYLQGKNGHSFENIKLDQNINDYGWSDSRWWVDVDGDGKNDYCRVVGLSPYTKIKCSFSNGKNFDQEITTPTIDAGYVKSRWWVDVNGDKRADYCRLTYDSGEYRIRCLLSLGRKFTRGDYTIRDAPPISADYGWENSVRWIDVNFDGVPDYCRGVGSYEWRLRCNLLNAPFEAKDLNPDYFGMIGSWDAPRYTTWYDLPKYVDSQWADVDGNGAMDYCLVLPDNKLSCVMVTKPADGGLSYQTGIKDFGYINPGGMNKNRLIDIDGDGKWDICKVNETSFSCALSNGTAFGPFTEYKNTMIMGYGGFYDKTKELKRNSRTGANEFCRITTGGNAVCILVSAPRQKGIN